MAKISPYDMKLPVLLRVSEEQTGAVSTNSRLTSTSVRMTSNWENSSPDSEELVSVYESSSNSSIWSRIPPNLKVEPGVNFLFMTLELKSIEFRLKSCVEEKIAHLYLACQLSMTDVGNKTIGLLKGLELVGCTGQVILRSYDEKIGQAPASEIVKQWPATVLVTGDGNVGWEEGGSWAEGAAGGAAGRGIRRWLPLQEMTAAPMATTDGGAHRTGGDSGCACCGVAVVA
uniref:Uncharacterized protein n=1 Tax=Oryza brachyantha TaxID=4533 RepID=J3L0T2_ORYBR